MSDLPPLTDHTPDAIRAWIGAVTGVTGMSATALAKAAGVAPSTLNKFLNDPGHASVLSARTLQKIRQAADGGTPPNRIKEHRAAAGLSLEAVAAKVGTDKSQIRRLEAGERRLTTDWMNRVAPALGVQPSDLLPEGASRAAPNASREHRVLVKADWWLTLDQATRIFAIVDEGKE